MINLKSISIFKNNTLLVPNAKLAATLFEKMKGLLGTKELKKNEGLLIPDCKQVHTYFMNYPIDVLFLDSEYKILKKQTLEPWKISPWIYKSKAVLELPKGFAEQKQLQEGDKLEVKENDPA